MKNPFCVSGQLIPSEILLQRFDCDPKPLSPGIRVVTFKFAFFNISSYSPRVNLNYLCHLIKTLQFTFQSHDTYPLTSQDSEFPDLIVNKGTSVPPFFATENSSTCFP